jgi:hypothetical protein
MVALGTGRNDGSRLYHRHDHADQEKVERLRRRYDGLKGSTERANCESHWQECGELMSPRKIDFVGMRTPGEKRMTKVYDPTGILASEMLAAGLHGMATNPASKWFSLRMVGMRYQDPQTGELVDVNELPSVQKYLSDVEQIMWQRIYAPGTNFTTSLHEIYLDLCVFGTAVLFVGQQENGGLLFEARPLAECVIDENADGRIDTVMRCSEYTVRQMVQLEHRLGWKVSDRVRDLAREEKWNDKVKVIHAVMPRADRDPSQRNAVNMPYVSCYFEHEACHLLHESGFAEFPYQVARWSKYAGELYGRSPGMTALPDLKMLQAMTLALIKIVQKNADPPMWLKDDGVVGPVRSIPGGVTYWRGNPNEGVLLQPTSIQGVKVLIEHIQMIKQQILQVFAADLMRMVDRANMTATEVVQRTNDQMRLFGPLVGRLESEMLAQLVERTFGILTRDKLLPDPPEEIQGQEFTVEFVSPVATAQKQMEANGVMQALGMVLQLAGQEMGPQLIAKRVDLDKLVSWLWDLFNNDPDLLRDAEELEQAAQMEQAQQAIGMAQPMVGMVKDGAGAMAQLAQAGATAAGAQSGDAGLNINELMQRFGREIADNPRAQQELQGLMNGEMPDEMDAEAIIPDEAII